MTMRLSYALAVTFAAAVLGCRQSANEPLREPADLVITRAMLTGSGGDPRGLYRPNSPSVQYFGILADSLTSTGGSGTLEIRGTSTTSGSFTFLYSPGVAGKIGNAIYSILAVRETTTGTWSVSGSRMYISFGTRVDTVSYTARPDGLILVVAYFNAVPPFSIHNVDHQIMSANDSTVWIFKR